MFELAIIGADRRFQEARRTSARHGRRPASANQHFANAA